MRFDILTIFPEIVDTYVNTGVIGRALNLKQKIDIRIHNIRDYSQNQHKKVDDTPFGGGAGMILQIEPIYFALQKIISENPETNKHIILTKAGADIFNQNKAIDLSKNFNHIIFICGRYEGVDARVEQYLSDESLSIGKFVLTGGELPALVMLDAISRHIPEVLGNQESLNKESWTNNEELEYPQYSRPEIFSPDNPSLVKIGSPKQWEVPKVLLSGNHKEIQKWKEIHTK